jgi:hypothetical protein
MVKGRRFFSALFFWHTMSLSIIEHRHHDTSLVVRIRKGSKHTNSST